MAWSLPCSPLDAHYRGGDMTSFIEHRSDECTGNWRLLGVGEDRTIQCDACCAEFYATPENRLAAIDENYAGIYLRRLSSEGAANRTGSTE